MLYTLKIYAQSNEVHFLWEDMTRLIFKVYHSKAPKHVSTGCFMCEKNYVLLLRFKLTCSIHYYFSSELCVCETITTNLSCQAKVKAWFLIHSHITLKHHRSLAKLRLNSDHNTVESWCVFFSILMFLPSLSGQRYFVK